MAVVLDAPGGIAPKLRAENLPPPYSQICRNVDLRSGKFTPRGGDRFRQFLKAGAKGFYFHKETAHALDAEGESVSVDIVQADGTAETRTFITSANQPLRVHIGDAADISAQNVGAPRPPKPLVEISNAARENRANLPAVPGGFALSLLMPDGTESQLSAVGNPDEIARVGDSIDIKILAADMAKFSEEWEAGGGTKGNFSFTGARMLVYRATAVGEFRQVGTASGFINSQADGTFGTAIPLVEGKIDTAEDFNLITAYILGAEVGAPGAGSVGAPKENLIAHESGTLPPEGMRHILLHPNRFLVAHTNRLICFSEVEQFGVWPTAKQIAIPEGEILTIAEHNGAIWVFPNGSPPRVIQLDAPGGGVAQTTETRYPCVSAGSVINMGGLGLFYASLDGIVRVPGGELLTADILDRSVPPSKWSPPTTTWAEGDEYVSPRHVLTPRSPHGGFMLSEKTDDKAVIATCARDGCAVLLDSNGNLWDAGDGERGEFQYTTRRMFFASRSSPARIRVVAKKTRAPAQSTTLSPRPYNFPAPLLGRDSPGNNAALGDVEFRAERAVGIPPAPKDFGFLPQPVGEGKVKVCVRTGGDVSESEYEDETVEFAPSTPHAYRSRADILTEEVIDAQRPLGKRAMSRWMEVTISGTDGREVSYVVIDPHSDSLKLAANQQIPQISVVPPFARSAA